VPQGEYELPLDRANVVRPGEHITVVAWGWVLHEALAAAELLAAEGIRVEVIDPRSLNPLDEDTLLGSVRRTGRLCVVHEDTRTMGLGAEIAARVSEAALDDLRAPVVRVAMADVAGIPASGPMEDFLIPERVRIAEALRQLARVDRGPRPMAAVNGLVQSSMNEAPQASSVVEVDVSRVVERLEQDRAAWVARQIEPDLTPFVVEALLAALKVVPRANAAFESGGIRMYPAVHLGLSVLSTDGTAARHGVIRDADTRNLLGLAMETQAVRAQGAAESTSLVEATVTLADYGPGSALFAVPLVLPGQSAAVRVGAVEDRLVTHARGMAIVPTVYLCAAIDHRVLDGMDAGALLGEMKRFLEQ
jgi:pyruvate/2-oxoglutarate dehydrogenase complex dihydrolipoamide acyltransferase (E2) component